MVKNLLVVFIISAMTWAYADEQEDCSAGEGSFLSGVVVKAPVFKHGKLLNGVELTHTLLSLQADQDGKIYVVAIDNVFASGYDDAVDSVPVPLNSIAKSDRLEVCGQLYPGGIHWVHTNCGKTPSQAMPNGWVKKIDAVGNASDNYESSTEYCKLWN